jgi:hypothetical protein
MNAKKEKALRRIANAIADGQNLPAMQFMAKSPVNRRTAVVAPQTRRGIVKTLKRGSTATPIRVKKGK